MADIKEIESAIKTIEVAIAEVEWNYPLDYAIAFETAVEVLQQEKERIEREKGCEYCAGEIIECCENCKEQYENCYIDCKKLDKYSIQTEIKGNCNFCPMCGRKLGESI